MNERASSLLLYYISDRSQFPGDELSRRRSLLAALVQAARCGIDYVQLREKNLNTRDLEILAGDAVRQLRTGSQERQTILLVNSRTDIALACGADGVHLRSRDISPSEVRNIWSRSGAGRNPRPVVAVSCHSADEVARAATGGADFVVFGPLFEKQGLPQLRPGGLDALHQACRARIPVLALGGVTLENARACMDAGAAGVAGIRLFQRNGMERTVTELRQL